MRILTQLRTLAACAVVGLAVAASTAVVPSVVSVSSGPSTTQAGPAVGWPGGGGIH